MRMITSGGGLICLWLVCACDALVPQIGGENQPCSTKDTCRAELVCVEGICCRENAYQQCGPDGHIYWFSSCDSQAGQVKACSLECEECVDAQSEPACQAQGKWLAGTDCGECVGNWDPARDCAQCREHWEDQGDDCSTCPGNWDSDQDCAVCVGNWDFTQDCGICRNHWEDQGDDCGTCPGNWDSAQDCNSCRGHWEGANCQTCPGNWDPLQDCGVCVEGFAGQDCTKAASCDGQPDYTLCENQTIPDYWYDICLDGSCTSPYACQDASCNPPGLDFKLPDTGQRKCFDDAGEKLCPGTPGDPGCATTAHCGQDAQYGWDIDNLPEMRFERTEPIQPETLVRDQVTGLLWQGCTRGRDGFNCGNHSAETANWDAAMDYCQELSWAGYQDWRLPTRLELQTLVDYGRSVPPMTYFDEIDYGDFPGTEPHQYWTSSTYAKDKTKAHIIHFGYGSGGSQMKDETHFVRCVRSSS